jgi:hypothetical protein
MTVEEHPAQRDLQLRRIQVGVPWANRMVLLIEDSNQPAAEVFDVARSRTDRRLVDTAGVRQIEVTEVGLVAGPGRRPRNMQS